MAFREYIAALEDSKFCLQRGIIKVVELSEKTLPIERAVPAMIFSAASIVVALRSGILVSAICRSCAAVSVPTLVLCGSALPLSTPMAFLISSGTGGVFVMKVNDPSLC